MNLQILLIYSIINISVAIFLNPQQTKYFGGLAVELKQAGFFSRYRTSESFVFYFSWVLIAVFFRSSFYFARLF